MDEMYDVFLSHASADKLSYVDELKKSFDRLGVSVFYDKDSIDWGDKWKDKIYEGLGNCRYGVIVVSKNFFGRYWTEAELHMLLNRQNNSGDKLILPILYGISLSDVEQHYKTLSDIQFLDSSQFTVKDITIKLARILLSDYKYQISVQSDSSQIVNTDELKAVLSDLGADELSIVRDLYDAGTDGDMFLVDLPVIKLLTDKHVIQSVGKPMPDSNGYSQLFVLSRFVKNLLDTNSSMLDN